MRLTAVILILTALFTVPAPAEDAFSDDRFRGIFTTENLDRIIAEYELNDGWYWTGEASVPQTFHGREGKPGWTDTAVNVYKYEGFVFGWYGYRWGKETINPGYPNDYGYGECFGFAQFIGYLLSGERNPHGKWTRFGSVYKAGGLKPGDIVRVDYKVDGVRCQHSAVVYSVEGNTVRFLQVSGSRFNLLRTGTGFYDGHLSNETDLNVIKKIPGLSVFRCPTNCEAAEGPT